MIIDCASCVGRPAECGDCVVTVVLGRHPGVLDLDAEERTAMAVLAGGGLVPPLRLMPISVAERVADGSDEDRRPRRAG
jgi:hypothetical protein